MAHVLDLAHRRPPASPTGRFVELPGEGAPLYVIEGYDALEPFLVTVTSPDDHWLFASTTGALTAGRVAPDRALLPYETDDRLHRLGGLRGPVTALRVRLPGGETRLWRPFHGDAAPGVTRNLLIDVEHGRRGLLYERLYDIAEALHVPVADLLVEDTK